MIYRMLKFVALILSILWFLYSPGFAPGLTFIGSVAMYFRDEIHGVVGWRLFSLTPRNSPIRNSASSRFSFIKPEFINPLIIEDLLGWISDTGDQIVAVNVLSSNSSNRYHGNIKSIPHNKYPIVMVQKEHGYFSYQYIGNSFSGIQLLHTWSSGGGTGVFESIIFVTLNEESAIDIEPRSVKRTNRLVVKKIASLGLGDRYEGEIRYRFGLLSISACKGRQSLRKKPQHLMVL